jgi:hypothetical protein
MDNVKIFVFLNNEILISQVEEVGSELGEPDCKLILPYCVKRNTEINYTLEPWLTDYTDQNYVMIHSDKILTIIDPKNDILEKYKSIIK